MLKSQDDFRRVIERCLAANHARCMDSPGDAKSLEDALVLAIDEEMTRYSEPEIASRPLVEDKVEARLKATNPAELGKFNDVLREGLLQLFAEILRLRKDELASRKMLVYTMRKRVEHENECPLFSDYRDHELDELKNHIRHMANTAHQAYHTDGQDGSKGWMECHRPFCFDAFQLVGARKTDEEG